jgi:hypothetical protein
LRRGFSLLGASLIRRPACGNVEDIMTDNTDPVAVLKRIMEKHPRAGSEKWLRIFEAAVIGSPALSRAIRLQAFTAALEALSKPN